MKTNIKTLTNHPPTVRGGPSITLKNRNNNSRVNQERTSPPTTTVKTITNAKTDGTEDIRVEKDYRGTGAPTDATFREIPTATDPVSLSFCTRLYTITFDYVNVKIEMFHVAISQISELSPTEPPVTTSRPTTVRPQTTGRPTTTTTTTTARPMTTWRPATTVSLTHTPTGVLKFYSQCYIIHFVFNYVCVQDEKIQELRGRRIRRGHW